MNAIKLNKLIYNDLLNFLWNIVKETRIMRQSLIKYKVIFELILLSYTFIISINWFSVNYIFVKLMNYIGTIIENKMFYNLKRQYFYILTILNIYII